MKGKTFSKYYGALRCCSLFRLALVVMFLLMGAVGAMAQSVIMNGNYYLTHNEAGTAVNATATTTFNPATCLWYVNNRYIQTADSNGDAFSGSTYLQRTSLTLGNTSQWTQASNGNTVYYSTGGWFSRTYYLRLNGTTWQISDDDSNNGRLYAVTISDVAPNVGTLTITAPADPTATGQYTGKSHVATSKPVQVVIDGCDEVSIEYVYGGGNAAPVPSTDLVIYGSYELGSVFGGGNGKDKYTRNNGATWNVNPGADVGINGGNYGTGNANTEVYGGFIHELYGASNQKGRIVGSINQIVKVDDSQSDCPLNVLKIVGAGKNADIDQDVNMVMGCMPTAKTELVFAGADNANVNGHVELTITSGTFGKVFGGNNLGGIIKGYIKVNVEETGCTPINIDELYLGGNQAAYSIYGYYQDGTLPDGRPRYLPRTSASDAHAAVDASTFPVPYAQPVLNVISCTSIGKVFGGGLGAGAAMYANPTVNINEVVGENANNTTWDYHQQVVNGETVGRTITYSDLGYSVTMPTHEAGKIGAIGTVFGGGNAAQVKGSTAVNVGTKTSIKYTSDAATDPARTVVGVDIRGNVFGGGNQADVTGNTNVVVGQ